MSGFDAGSVTASLSVDTAKAKADLDKIKAEVADLEKDHRIKISAVFDSASVGKARKIFADLDNMLSRDAAQRLKSSPQGSVLGALNSLFSPHPVTGAPSAQQAAQSGLLGRMVTQQGGGGPVGAAGRAGAGGAGGAGGSGGTSTTNAVRDLLTGQQPGNTSTTNTIKDVTQGQQPGNVTTTDTIKRDVTGSAPGNIETTDTIKEKVDPASRAQAIADSADTGDKSGASFASRFTSHIAGMLNDFRTRMGSTGKTSGTDMGKGLIDGIGPSILGIPALFATKWIAGIGTALAALPALAGIIGAGMGVAMIGGLIAGVVAGSPQLKAQLKGLAGPAQDALKTIGAPIIPALSAAFKQIPALLKSITGPLTDVMKTVAPQIAGVFAGLTPIIRGLVGIMSAAAPAFGPVIGGLEKLVANILPGIQIVIRAMGPFLSQFAGILGTLGTHLGQFFSAAAPAIGASMKVLGALLNLIGGLLPVIIKLGGAFATALAPVLASFAGAIRALMPTLVTIGKILASLAQAVLGDLASAFTALATLLVNISPSLNTLATALGSVFTQLENTGVFAEVGDALESLATPLGNLINALVQGLEPALPIVVDLLGKMAGAVTTGFVVVLGGIADAFTAIIRATPPDVLTAIGVALAGIVVSVKLLSLGKSAFAGLQSMVATLKGLLGMGSAKAAAAPEQMQAAGDTMAEAAAAMQKAADTMAGAGQAEETAGAEQETAGAEDAAAGKAGIAGGGAAGAGEGAAAGGAGEGAAAGAGAGGGAAVAGISLAPVALGLVIGGIIKAIGDTLSPKGTNAGSVSNIFQQTGAPGASITGGFVGWLANALGIGTSKPAKPADATSPGTVTTQKLQLTPAPAAAFNTAAGAIAAYSKVVAQAGTGTLAASIAFNNAVTAIGAEAAAFSQSHAPAAQSYADIENQIAALKAKGPLNAQETAELGQLQSAADALANSTAGLTAQQVLGADQIENSLLPALDSLHANTPLVRTDMDNLANSIQTTGSNSAATAGDRAQLLKDLIAAGVNAQTAQQFVDQLGKAVTDLPSGKTISITMKGDGTYTIAGGVATSTATGSGGGSRITNKAAGGRITGGTGPTADDVLIRVSKGETVVSAADSRKLAPAFKALGIPGYASGGAVTGNLTPAYVSGMYASFQDQMTAAMVTAMQAAIKAAAAAAKAVAAGASGGGGSDAANIALADKMAAARGWTGAQITALNEVIARESGGSSTVVNASSGAAGIAQNISGFGPGYASGNAAQQIAWMLNYIASRYGTPEGAEAHEVAYGWYGQGGPILEPITGVGVSGRMYKFGEAGPEYVVPGNKATGMPGAIGGSRMEALLEQLIAVTGSLPHGITGGIGTALSGAAQSASFRQRYPRGGS